MEKRFSLILDKEFIEYCRINNIEDVEKKAKEVFQKGFMILKYGNNPLGIFTPRPMSTPLPSSVLSNQESISKDKNNLYDE